MLLMGRLHVWTLLHRCPCDSWPSSFVNSRLRVHSLYWNDVSKCGISCRLRQLRLIGVRSGIVADEMEVLAAGGGDTERLLHESVWFVSVSVGSFTIQILILIASSSAIWCLSRNPPGWWRYELTSSSLALHFSIGKKASRNSAGTP